MSKHKYAQVAEGNHGNENILANHKRFKPQDVIKMGPNATVPFEKQIPDEAPAEKQLSEAELQLKDMVKKQMNKNITLESELAREKRFLTATVYKDDQEKRAGALSLEQFKQHTEAEQQLQNLRDYGLTDREIVVNVPEKEGISLAMKSKITSGLGQSEMAVQRAKDAVAEKIKSRDAALKSDTSYSNAREMTRREMEIEQSLYRSTEKAQELKHLVKQKVIDYSKNDPVIQTLKEYEDRERLKCSNRKQKSQKNKKNSQLEEDDDDDDDDDGVAFVGPVLAPLHVRVKPLDEAEVTKNKLSLEEIKSIPKFKNYDPGIPSKVLYVKNLPRDTSKEDLAKLFVRFESFENPVMEYKIMDGRMKGQAFITFKDVGTAQKALQFANGFILKDKPIIVAFGKGKES